MGSKIFVLLGGSRGILPQKILKIKCLRLVEIRFPTIYFEDSFISHSVTNYSCNWRSFQNISLLLSVLNFHFQRHFDDCLKISVLGHFDRNYKPGLVLNCALKLCAFFQKDLNYDSDQILPPLYISLISDSLVKKFQTLTKY